MNELPGVRSLFHSLLDKHLCVDAAAAVLQDWSDRQRGVQRQWEHLPEANKELYRLLCYRIACTLVGQEAEPDDIAFQMDTAVARAEEQALDGKELVLG